MWGSVIFLCGQQIRYVSLLFGGGTRLKAVPVYDNVNEKKRPSRQLCRRKIRRMYLFFRGSKKSLENFILHLSLGLFLCIFLDKHFDPFLIEVRLTVQTFFLHSIKRKKKLYVLDDRRRFYGFLLNERGKSLEAFSNRRPQIRTLFFRG